MPNRRVVVTGGTGFVGCHVSAELLRRDCELVLFDIAPDLDTLQRVVGDVPLDGVRVIVGDVGNPVEVFRAVAEVHPDTVIHLASPLPPDAERDTGSTLHRMVDGHVNVLEAARLWQIRKVVWASATSVFGSPEWHGGLEAPVSNDAPHHPETLYGICKSTCERLSELYRSRHHVDSVGLRLAQGYGPGKKRGRPFGHELFERALSGEPYQVPYGDDLVNWQYVGDIAKLLVMAADAAPFPPVALNTTGDILTMRESVDLLREICPRATLTVGPGTTGLVWRYDTTVLHRVLGDVPNTTARAGFAQTLVTMGSWRRQARILE